MIFSPEVLSQAQEWPEVVAIITNGIHDDGTAYTPDELAARWALDELEWEWVKDEDSLQEAICVQLDLLHGNGAVFCLTSARCEAIRLAELVDFLASI